MSANSEQKVSIMDKPLSKGQGQVSLSAFSYLFLEMVQYSVNQMESVEDLEKRLSDYGHDIGLRLLELYSNRLKVFKREKNLIAMLQFIYSTVWKNLFGKQADGLQESTESENEYYIFEKEPITNRFISVPKDYGKLNCAAFVAGIIRGLLNGAEFTSEVSALWNSQKTQTVYVITHLSKNPAN